MIKIHFVATVKALGADVGKRLAEQVRKARLTSVFLATDIASPFAASYQNLSEPALRALLYSKPLALVPSIAPLMRELQLRSPSSRSAAGSGHSESGETGNIGLLVDECAAAWVSFRLGVLGGVVAAEVARLDPSRGDLVDLVRPLARLTCIRFTKS